MKKILKTFLGIIALLLLVMGCSERGPVGPEGPRGPQGPAGPEILPTTFEFNADLTSSNGFEFFQDIPSEIEVLESDVVLVFVLEDYIPEDDLEVWRKLPITEFTSRGTRLLDYDFTFVDVRIFMDANYTLQSADGLQDVLMRAVHVPSDFMAKSVDGRTLDDISTYHELESYLGIDIRKL